MKIQLLAVVVAIAVAGIPATARAEEHPAKTLDVALREMLQPTVKEWVTKEALKLLHTPAPQEIVARRDIRTRYEGQGLSEPDEDRLTYLATMEASQAADQELKKFLAQVKAAKPADKVKPGLQTGVATGTTPDFTSRSGKITFQPGRPLNGSSSIGISGASVGSGPASNSPDALQLSPADTQRLKNLTDSRNQLVTLANNLGRRIPRDLHTQIQNLK